MQTNNNNYYLGIELLKLDWNTWNDLTVCKFFVLIKVAEI